MDGCWKGPIPGNNRLIAPVEGNGMRFQAVLWRRLPDGGESQAADASVRIEGADAVTFIVTAATSFVNYHDISGDPAAACAEGSLGRPPAKITPTLRRRHEDRFPRADGPRASDVSATAPGTTNPPTSGSRRSAMAAPIRTWKPCVSSSAVTSWSPAAVPADSRPTSRESGTNRSRRPGAASTRSTSTPR